jgi:dTDP-4-dehydrorhamnose reductase
MDETDGTSGLTPPRLELWGGVECTVNRVGDRFHDQLRASGHHERDGDIDAVAWLGVKAVRYPVLWERAESRPGCHEFAWSDRRLAMLQTHDITPIVGLLHHGSGPPHTHLLDPRFPQLFASYAGAVARRYPWVDFYTPINEPHTTARFSALHGHWYPHHRSDEAEEVFATLVRVGKVPVEFVRYPGGDHHLAEQGSPSHRIDYTRRFVEWVERWTGRES